jgi:3-dehydroquinate dehydratase
LSKGSVEAEALENTIRRKKIQEQEKELWQMIIYAYGMETYEEMIQERRRIATERTRIAHLQSEKRKAAALNTVYLGLTAGLGYLGYLMALFVIDNWPKG